MRSRLYEAVDHARQCQGLRRNRERETALRPAGTLQHSRLYQGVERLAQVISRGTGRVSELVRAKRPLLRVSSENQYCSQGVV